MDNLIEINGVFYKNSDGVLMPVSENDSTRVNSWITLAQINWEYPEFIDKIADVLYEKEYNNKAKDFARNILEWLNLWKFVSWKQFDSIFRICARYDDFKASYYGKNQIFKMGNIYSIKSDSLTYTYRGPAPKAWTDKYIDTLHTEIFKCRPMFAEEAEDGMSVAYRSDGSRYFALPTGKEQLSDFMHFGINFKGLRI